MTRKTVDDCGFVVIRFCQKSHKSDIRFGLWSLMNFILFFEINNENNEENVYETNGFGEAENPIDGKNHGRS